MNAGGYFSLVPGQVELNSWNFLAEFHQVADYHQVSSLGNPGVNLARPKYTQKPGEKVCTPGSLPNEGILGNLTWS